MEGLALRRASVWNGSEPELTHASASLTVLELRTATASSCIFRKFIVRMLNSEIFCTFLIEIKYNWNKQQED